ncbi:DUF397 domain-containing protein [Streptomyces acidicola]|uniref:DUF397 domain-containing protein n=1 Tax=Streptomyces acidicola TaxID=2596892 RepID=UPI00381BFA62
MPGRSLAVLQRLWADGLRCVLKGCGLEGGEAVGHEARRMAHTFRWQPGRECSLDVDEGDAPLQPDGDSGDEGPDCVEIAIAPAHTTARTTVHVRDSKDRNGARLAFTSRSWAAFVGSYSVAA